MLRKRPARGSTHGGVVWPILGISRLYSSPPPRGLSQPTHQHECKGRKEAGREDGVVWDGHDDDGQRSEQHHEVDQSHVQRIRQRLIQHVLP